MVIKKFIHRIPVIILRLILAGLLFFPSCKDEPFEYKLDRASAFSFRLDTFDVVTTNEVIFYPGSIVMHEFEDSIQVLFQRITLEAHGLTPSSIEYWLIVDFDTHADGDAVGLYRAEYDVENGGISDMRLIINENGTLLEYKADLSQNAVYFQVDAQHKEERLMKGVFGGILYRDGDPGGQPAIISDGVFKDISY